MNQIVDFSSAYRQLRPSERTFVDGYVSDLETKAVKSGEKLHAILMLPNDVDERSKSFLALSLVRAAIAERVKDLQEEMELSVYKTLKELRALAYSNVGNYMDIDDEGHLYFNFTKCTPEQLSAVKSFKVKQRQTQMGPVQEIELVMHDKVAALDKTMKHQGLLDDNYWRSENAKTVRAETLTAEASDDEAAELYARMING